MHFSPDTGTFGGASEYGEVTDLIERVNPGAYAGIYLVDLEHR